MEEDKLHKSYIWHIVTLAKMKYLLRKIVEVGYILKIRHLNVHGGKVYS